VVNLFIEACPADIGVMIAADYANQAGETYLNEIGEDFQNMALETEFSYIVRLRGGPGSETLAEPGMMGNCYKPVGLFQENLPKTAQFNPLKSLFSNSGRTRPIWTYKPFRGNGQATIYSHNILGFRIRVNLNISYISAYISTKFKKYKYVKLISESFLVIFYLYYCYKIIKIFKKLYPFLQEVKKVGIKKTSVAVFSKMKSKIQRC